MCIWAPGPSSNGNERVVCVCVLFNGQLFSNGNVIIIAKLPHSHITSSIDRPLGSYANHIDEWISHNSLVVSPNQISMRLRSSKSWTSLSASPPSTCLCLSLRPSVRLSVCVCSCRNIKAQKCMTRCRFGAQVGSTKCTLALLKCWALRRGSIV